MSRITSTAPPAQPVTAVTGAQPPTASDDPFAIADAALAEMAVLPPGDPRRAALRDQLICRCIPIARREASRYRRSGEAADDLGQVALLGLILAIDRYDAQRGVAFRHFAIPTIAGELKRHFRDRSWSVRVSRRMQELSLMIRSREPELAQRLGRTPTNADLAADLGVDEREIRQGQEAISVHKAQSLNVPLYHDGESKDLADVLGAADGDLESLADRDALGRAMRVLPERYAEVLRLRFVDELTQTQIADKIGSSQMHVSRMISRAVALLRKHMVAERPAPLPT